MARPFVFRFRLLLETDSTLMLRQPRNQIAYLGSRFGRRRRRHVLLSTSVDAAV